MLKRIYKYSSLEESLAVTPEEVVVEKTTSYEYDSVFGNLSYQGGAPMCDGCFCADTCPNHPLLWRIVRWVKIIARSKHGMTVLFSAVPLFLGLLVGIYLGRQWEKSKQSDNSYRLGNDDENFGTKWSLLSGRLMHKISLFFFVLQAWVSELLHFVLTAHWLQPFSSSQSTINSHDSSHDISTVESCSTTSIPVAKVEKRRQSGVDLPLVPKHIAVIMDGNRRYGKSKYKSASRGHVDGGYKLRDMVHWCLEECVQEMTVYAFSTENWNRSQAEISALMDVFCQQCEELRKESVKLQIIVRVLSTQTELVSTS